MKIYDLYYVNNFISQFGYEMTMRIIDAAQEKAIIEKAAADKKLAQEAARGTFIY